MAHQSSDLFGRFSQRAEHVELRHLQECVRLASLSLGGGGVITVGCAVDNTGVL